MPRLPTVAQSELPSDQPDLVTSVLQDRPLNVYATIANNAQVLAGLRVFLKALWADTGLTERERELVILAVARTLDSEYEWHQHVRIAIPDACTPEEVSAIAERDFEAFSPRESLLLEYVTEVLSRTVSDERHAQLEAEYTHAQLVGIASLSAGYQLLAVLIDAFEIEPEEPFVGWTQR